MNDLASRFLVAALAVPAGATGPAIAGCPGQTQLEMNDCAAADYAVADAALNAVWSVVKPRMDSIGAGAKRLDAQRKWLAFRDAACSAEVDFYEGGSIAPLVHSDCLTRLTQRRTEDLRALVN